MGHPASRQLERACKREDAFRFLAGGLRPDHNSICRFRRQQAAQLPRLFAQTVRLCQEAGLVALGEVALDGTKLRANRAKATLRAAQQLTQALEEAEAADLAHGSEAEEECAFLKTGEGIVPAYNAQLAVDGAHQVILACEVDTAANDHGHLAPLVEQVQQTCGEAPEKVLADGSYSNINGIAQVEAQGIAVYLPVRESGQAQVAWVEEEGAYRCLAGPWLRPGRQARGRASNGRGCAWGTTCGSGRGRWGFRPLWRVCAPGCDALILCFGAARAPRAVKRARPRAQLTPSTSHSPGAPGSETATAVPKRSRRPTPPLCV